MLIGLTLSAQTTVSVLHTPQNKGWGMRLDQQEGNYGLYASFSYGDYEYRYDYIKDFTRLAIGATKHSELSYVGIGVAYNYFGETNLQPGSRALIPVSIEMCTGTKINRFTFGLAVDVVNFNIGLTAGFKFNKQSEAL